MRANVPGAQFCLAISIAMMYNIIYKLNLIEQIYMTEP